MKKLYPVLNKLFLACALLSMSACAYLGVDVRSANNGEEQARAFVATAPQTDDGLEHQDAELEEVTEYKDFRPETLYALMLAEIALERDFPELSLSYYRREAYETRDPGVIQRALEISAWLEAHQVSLELIALWRDVEPDNSRAHQVMAQQQLYFGQFYKALDSVERVLALGESFNFDYLNQMIPELPEEQRLGVLRRLEELSETFPQESQIWLSRAHLYALLDQRQSALDAAKKARRLNRNDDRPVLMHAELQFNYHDHDKALREMEKGMRRFPDSKALHYLYAQSLLKLGKVKKAEQQITNSLQSFSGEFEYYYQLALLSASYKLNHVATQLLQENLHHNYRKQEAYFHLSRISQTEGNFDEAISYLHQIKPGAGFIEARLEIAYLLIEQGLEQEAIQSLQQAHLLQADNQGVFYQAQADLFKRMGEYAMALASYSEAIGTYPDSIKLHYARAMLAESIDRLDIAEQDLLTIIDMEPDNAMALNALGYTLTNKTQRHQEALGYIERAYALRPNDPAIIDSMGWVHYQLGNYEGAISYLRKAIAMEADHEIAAHLGEVLWVSGSKQEAKRIWTEALANNQDSEALKSVMNRFLK